MTNIERLTLINQYKILSLLESNKHNTSGEDKRQEIQKKYNLKIEILEKRMEQQMKDLIFGENDAEDLCLSEKMEERAEIFHEALKMYENLRLFLLKHKIADKNLIGDDFKILYDQNEIENFPYENLEVYHKNDQFLNLKMENCGYAIYFKHKEKLKKYKQDLRKININNYKDFL